jgi:hypothetical protein
MEEDSEPMFGNPLLDLVVYVEAAQFLFGPLAVRLTNSAAAHPNLVPIQPEQIPVGPRAPLSAAEAQIRNLGFERIGYIHMQANKPAVDTYFVLLINRTTRVRALAAQMSTAVKSIEYVGFCNVFSDNSELNTTNSRTAGAFKPDPERPSFRFPNVTDLRVLLQVHTKLLQEKAALRTSVLPDAGQEINSIIQNWNRSFQQQIKFGYYYLDASADRYRPTMMGAIAMTWKLAWPVGMIRTWIAQSRGESQLRRWGFARS